MNEIMATMSKMTAIVRDAQRLDNTFGIEDDTADSNIALSNYITQCVGNSRSSFHVEADVKFTLDGKRETIHVILREWQPARASEAYNGDDCLASKGNSNSYLEKWEKGGWEKNNLEVSHLAVYLADGILKGFSLSGETGIKGKALHILTLSPLKLTIDNLKITRKVKSKIWVMPVEYSWKIIKAAIVVAKHRQDETDRVIPIGKGRIRGRASNMDW